MIEYISVAEMCGFWNFGSASAKCTRVPSAVRTSLISRPIGYINLIHAHV